MPVNLISKVLYVDPGFIYILCSYFLLLIVTIIFYWKVYIQEHLCTCALFNIIGLQKWYPPERKLNCLGVFSVTLLHAMQYLLQ